MQKCDRKRLTFHRLWVRCSSACIPSPPSSPRETAAASASHRWWRPLHSCTRCCSRRHGYSAVCRRQTCTRQWRQRSRCRSCSLSPTCSCSWTPSAASSSRTAYWGRGGGGYPPGDSRHSGRDWGSVGWGGCGRRGAEAVSCSTPAGNCRVLTSWWAALVWCQHQRCHRPPWWQSP